MSEYMPLSETMGVFLLYSVQIPLFYIYGYMLALTLGNTDDKMVVTLNEFITIDAPYFLFIFTSVTTRQTVAVIYTQGADLSSYPYRYNEFEINTTAIFGNYQPGEWHYTVYQQASATNINPDLAAGILEYGKMRLYPAVNFAYTEYNSPTTYIAYNG